MLVCLFTFICDYLRLFACEWGHCLRSSGIGFEFKEREGERTRVGENVG